MSVTDVFSKLCSLEAIGFIAGEYYLLETTVTDEFGNPSDLSSTQQRRISLAYFGINDELFHVDCDASYGTNFSVFSGEIGTLTSSLVPGKLIYQISIVDAESKLFNLGQGRITLLSKIA